MCWCQLWAVRAARVTAAQVGAVSRVLTTAECRRVSPLSLSSDDGDILGGGLAAAAQVPQSAPELGGQAAADREPAAGGRQGAAGGQQPGQGEEAEQVQEEDGERQGEAAHEEVQRGLREPAPEAAQQGAAGGHQGLGGGGEGHQGII